MVHYACCLLGNNRIVLRFKRTKGGVYTYWSISRVTYDSLSGYWSYFPRRAHY